MVRASSYRQVQKPAIRQRRRKLRADRSSPWDDVLRDPGTVALQTMRMLATVDRLIVDGEANVKRLHNIRAALRGETLPYPPLPPCEAVVLAVDTDAQAKLAERLVNALREYGPSTLIDLVNLFTELGDVAPAQLTFRAQRRWLEKQTHHILRSRHDLFCLSWGRWHARPEPGKYRWSLAARE